MIRVRILDGPNEGALVNVPHFRSFEYLGTHHYIHTAGLHVHINQYCFRVYTDIGSISRDFKKINLTAAIEQGIWTVESLGQSAPFLYKTQALTYKTRADWVRYASHVSGYGVSPENLRGRRLTWKERLLGKIICP